MITKEKWIVMIIFSLLALILAIIASTSPWWGVYTSKNFEILNKSIIRIEYELSGAIKATRINSGNQTVFFNVMKIQNLTLQETMTGMEFHIPNKLSPKKEVFGGLAPTEISFGTYDATFEGKANITTSSIWLIGHLVIHDHKVLINITCDAPASFNIIPSENLKTWLKATCQMKVSIKPVIISIWNLDSAESNKANLDSFFKFIWSLTLIGSGSNLIVFIYILFSALKGKTSLSKYINYITVTSAIIFLISFICFISEGPTLISRLENIAPPEVYELEGRHIKSLFGSLESLVYGPTYGCYLALVMFFMNVALYNLAKKIKFV